jgi:hypothetical protein
MEPQGRTATSLAIPSGGESPRVEAGGAFVETVDSDGFTAEAIDRVVSAKTLILRVRGFYCSPEAEVLRATISEKLAMRGYQKEPALQYGGGKAYFDLSRTREKVEEYFANAARWMATNAALAPVEWPLERIRRHLDVVWPQGARLARDRNGRVGFAGLARKMEGHGPLLPHLDDLLEDDVHRYFAITKIIAQLSVLVYLAMPRNGSGGLHVWNKRPGIAERVALRDPEHPYRLMVDSASDALVVPEVGDLLLFNANNIHMVDNPDGLRMTVSTFFLVTPEGPGLLYS